MCLHYCTLATVSKTGQTKVCPVTSGRCCITRKSIFQLSVIPPSVALITSGVFSLANYFKNYLKLSSKAGDGFLLSCDSRVTACNSSLSVGLFLRSWPEVLALWELLSRSTVARLCRTFALHFIIMFLPGSPVLRKVRNPVDLSSLQFLG